MASTRDYLLGHTAREWDRLDEQHALWGPVLLDELRALGVGPEQSALEVGCGTGALLADLRELTGHAVGLERDPASAERAAERLGEQAVVRVGDLMEAELGGPYDVVVARWVLSFLPDPQQVVARLAAAVRPGGRLVVQDYNHDGLDVWPQHFAIERVVAAIRSGYAARGGDLWVAAKLPGLFRAAGLREVRVTPHVMAGAPGSPVWGWVERFVLEHLDTWVEGGQLRREEAVAFEQAWTEARADPATTLFSPMVVTVSGVR